jgi:hypothetical protein
MTLEREAPTVMNTNEAPFPFELQELVRSLRYRPGWTFSLDHIDRGQGSKGLTFVVTTSVYDTYAPDQPMRVAHYMPVPPASFDRGSWQRWMLDQLLEIEVHEACEFFQIDGGRPFAPNHGPGRNPYTIRELGTVEDAETSFRGERDEGSQGG